MSGDSRARIVVPLLLSAVASTLGWLLIFPIAMLIPKHRDWVAVIGRQNGAFLDNAKFFYLQAGQCLPTVRWVFVTGRHDVAGLFRASHREVLRYPGIAAIWCLIRCNVVVVDESSWFRRARGFLLGRAKVMQLWHGVGCKRIELDRWRHEAGGNVWASSQLSLRLRMLAYRLTGRWTRYAVVAATSHFYVDHVFAAALAADHFLISGYPRNDFALSLEGGNHDLAWSNVDQTIRAKLEHWQRSGRKLVLVAPTFRDSGTLPMQLDANTLSIIDDFGEKHGVEFIFKFHPAERNADSVTGNHFHVCARDSDIYPVMPYLAALVTDYSSISMDFLLVDKPLLFLIPDDDDYATNDRQLQFDPRTMMPGPVVPTWETLLSALLDAWANDHHASERAALRSKAFDDLPQSEAVPRLLAFMREQGWIADRAQPHRR